MAGGLTFNYGNPALLGGTFDTRKVTYSPAGGQVLGATAPRTVVPAGPPAATQRTGAVRTSAPAPVPQYQAPQQQAPEDPYAQIRSEISSAWDNYLNSLGQTSGYIDQQRAAQEGIVSNQLAEGQTAVNAQKASSLKDIANTTRNAFQAGNNYLGQLGAGDSSAANQYAFAINQEASKQTGDLNNFVNGQLNQLKSDADLKMTQIAQWFASAQEQLKQQIASGELQKGQDLSNLSKGILDQAIQATNAIKTNTMNQQNALVQWAAENSSNLGQLQNNISQIPGVMGQLQFGAGVGAGTPSYGGAPSGAETDIWGNRIP